MRLIPLSDAEQVGRRAARYIAERIRCFAPDAQRPFVLGLPTGSTPLPAYRELVRLHRAGELSFRHVVTFNMDEYVGLPPDHPQSYHAFMHRHLFSQMDIFPGNIHLPDGMAGDPNAECLRYEALLRRHGPVNLFLGSIGVNGHLAFNEPGSSADSRTRVVTLADATRQANARFFDQDPSSVPGRALTVGLGTLLEAEEILLLVTGVHKARALQAMIEQPASPQWPASVLQRHANTLVLCDHDASRQLTQHTLRRFQHGNHLAPCHPE